MSNSALQPTLNGDPDVAIIIVNYCTPDLTQDCLRSVATERERLPKLRALVVDGGSPDDSANILSKFLEEPEFASWASLLSLPINGGFGWANNQAISKILRDPNSPEFIHLLNPDCEIESGAVEWLVNYLLDHPNAGAVASQLLEMDGSTSGSAFKFPTLRGEFCRGARTGVFNRLLKVPSVATFIMHATEVDWVTGASVMFRITALQETGAFDEGFFLYHEETELMWRLRAAGWNVAVEPRSRVRHVGGASTGVNSRPAEGQVQPRKPTYWYRSRTRLFALTRGRAIATLAYFAWLAGHLIWRLRRAFGLAPGSKPVSHQLRDHARYAFPQSKDHVPAVRTLKESPSVMPAWMERGAL